MAFLLTGCVSVSDHSGLELVMKPGETIEVSTSQGEFQISYEAPLTRGYAWDDQKKKFRHQPRTKRWNGSLGMYRAYGDSSIHAVLEEGQQHFPSVVEAQKWLTRQGRFMDYVWTQDGLVAGWSLKEITDGGNMALHVSVWQILVNGEKPSLPDASPSKIRVLLKE